jgi:hypothetical protein
MGLRRYVATGRGGPGAVLAVLGASLAGGAVTGALEAVVDRWFSLLVLFPLIIGGVAGGLAAWMIGRHRLRAPLLALVLGAAGGAAGYLTVHAINYVQFRVTFVDDMKPSAPSAGEAEAPDQIDHLLMQVTGHAGFRGYLEIAAQHGVSIKRVGASDPGIALSGIGAWLLWLAELVFAAGMAGFIAYRRANEPFCEDCGVWFGLTQRIATGGSGTQAAREQLISALQIGDFARAAAVLVAAPAKSMFLLKSTACPRCGAECYCTLERVTRRNKADRVKVLESWLLTKAELAQLTDAIARAKARPAAVATQV